RREVSGTVAVGYREGVDVPPPSNQIGGLGPGEGNLISGNLGAALLMSSTGTVVQGNKIGTDITGTKPLGNVGVGISFSTSAANDQIGGTVAAAGNVIAHSSISPGIVLAGTGNAI